MIQYSVTNFLAVCLILQRFSNTQCLVFPIEIISASSATTTLATATTLQSSLIDGTFLLSSLNNESKQTPELPFSTTGFQRDQVVRVLDANTIKLSKNGIVSLAGVRMPTPGTSNFQFPDCFTSSPSYKLRQLLPPKTSVLVEILASGSKTPLSAVLVRSEDSVFVNQEIVSAGFGKVLQKVSNNPDLQKFLNYNSLKSLQDEAKAKGLGIFKLCDEEVDAAGALFEAEFEPLELTVETKWGDDGGKQILRKREDTPQGPPKNPGDRKGCSDFVSYEDAFRWFDYYKPWYGDVAKLDRDGDGVPCPGLPHTNVPEKYRMKVPNNKIVD